MGGGKETPRQKMVGLMYLVLMALLAMNTAKTVVNSFILIDGELQKTNDNFSSKNNATYNAFDKAAMADPRAEKWKKDAHEVQNAANELYEHIHILKNHVIAATEGITVEQAEDFKNADADGKVGLWRAQQKDNYDKPTQFLFGSGDNARTDEWSAEELKEMVKVYRSKLISIVGDKAAEALHLSTEELDAKTTNDAGVSETWGQKNFDHLPLVAVICNLTKMQTDVRNQEADVIKQLYSHIGKDDFKFDKLAVKVIPKSKYVILNDTFHAEVMVAAYSSASNPVLKASDDIDTTGGEVKINGEIDPLRISTNDGMGVYKFKATKEGTYTWGGRIGILKPGKIESKAVEDDYKWYPFTDDYTVAKPSLVVSATAMNVVYRGIENPIEVSVPGVPTDKLQISISNASKSGSNGKFKVKPGNGKLCVVNVSADIDGKKTNYGKMEFRVKNVPDPKPSFMGKSDGVIKRSELKAASFVLAKLENFDFEGVRYRISGFNLSATVRGNLVDQSSTSAKLTSDQKAMLKALGPGSKFYIEKIKAVGPDGSTRDLGTIGFKVM